MPESCIPTLWLMPFGSFRSPPVHVSPNYIFAIYTKVCIFPPEIWIGNYTVKIGRKLMSISVDGRKRLDEAKQSNALAQRQLRGLGWLNGLMHAYDLDEHELHALVETGKARTGTSRKWLAGETIPKSHSASQLDEKLPGAAKLYESPFFELLKDSCHGNKADAARIEAADNLLRRQEMNVDDESQLARYVNLIADTILRIGAKHLSEQAPFDSPERKIDYYCTILDISAVMLGRARAAEGSESVPYEHSRKFREFLDWVPWLLSLPLWDEALEGLLRGRISGLLGENIYSGFTTRILWDVIDDRLATRDFNPIREHRPRDPVDDRFMLPEPAWTFLDTKCPECGHVYTEDATKALEWMQAHC